MSKYKAVLFDYDDTLADTFKPRLIAATNAAEGELDPSLDMDRIMKEWAGRPQIEIFTSLTGNKEKARALTDEYTKWYWKLSAQYVELFVGVKDMLERLESEGIPIALVTSKVRLLENEDGPYGAEVEMERLGIRGLFDVVVGWEDITDPKPAPQPILHALDQLSLSPSEALMVGDSHIDIKTAKAAKTPCVGATWGTLAKELLLEESPDFLIHTPSELYSIVF